MTRLGPHYWLLVLAVVFLPTKAITAPAATSFSVLDTSALISSRAISSAILSLAKAGERLVAVGERGIILLSDDAGHNWRQVNTPVSVTFTAVQFVSARSGWVVGHFGVVLHTEDGGETWVKQLDGFGAAELAVEAAKEQVSIGEPRAQQALTEARYLVEDGPDKPFLDLYFINDHTGYIVGAYNLIYKTEDAGRSWHSWQAHIDNPDGLHLYGIRAVGDEIFIVGERGLLLKGDLSSGTFRALNSPYEGSYFGLIAGQDGDVFIFGLRGNTFRSTDQGMSWSRVNLDSQVSMSAGCGMEDGALVLVSQAGAVFVRPAQSLAFTLHQIRQTLPLTSAVQAGDHAIVVGSLRGLMRIDLGTGQ